MKKKRVKKITIVGVVIAVAVIGIYVFISGVEDSGTGGENEMDGGGADFPTLENTVQTYYEALNNRNADQAYSRFSSELKNYYTKSWMEDRISFFKDFNFHHEVQEITETSISGNTATIKFKLKVTQTNPETENTKSIEFELLKENKEWKINQIIKN